MNLEVGQITDRGRTRSSNQDSVGISHDVPPVLLTNKGRLLVVADGFGKDAAGLQASRAAVDVLTRAFYGVDQADVGQALVQAMHQANVAAFQATSDVAPEQAGTTLTAAVVRQGVVSIAHVGDSRAYLLRAGQLTPLTQDHSWAAEQVKAGKLTPEQAAQHPKRRNLTRALGIQATIDVDLVTQAFGPGDTLLLCSDGLVDQVSEAEIIHALQTGSAQAASQRLVDLANHHGGGDNVSVVVARIASAPGVASSWLPWAIIGGVVGFVLLLLALLSGGQPQQVAQATPVPVQDQPGVVTVTVVITQIVPAPTIMPDATATLPAQTPLAVVSPSQAATPNTPVAPSLAYPAPAILSPNDGAAFRGRQEQIRLRWQSVGTLGPDDYYVVLTEYPREGQVWRDEQQTRETELVLPDYLFDLATGTREFTWRVVVWRDVQQTVGNRLIGDPISPASAPRRLIWLADEAGPSATETSQAPTVEPTGIPTQEPTAIPTQEPTPTPGFEG